MNLAPAILGSSAVNKLTESHTTAVLQVGKDRLTRAQLAAVDCFNFSAARSLGHILTTELGVTSLRQLYDTVPPSALAVPRLGVVSLAVLGAAFEAVGIGGATPLESYVAKHSETIVTFDTLKAREAKELAEERKATKRRKGQRRDKAQALRVERFGERDVATAAHRK